ncbi:MAG: hypothetical protein HC897_19915 [Thermoanaerobaculia bacterium]|nr:hypothetical protein [Thermoanaerobaculia bacterium]
MNPVDFAKGSSRMITRHGTCRSLVPLTFAAFVILGSWASLPVSAGEPVKVAMLPIVERSIAFHGGEVFGGSRISLSICSRSGCFSIQACIDGALFDYVVEGEVRGKRRKVHWTNDPEARPAGQDGDLIEEWLDGTAIALDATGRQSAQDFVSARVYFPFLPFRLADPSAWKQDLGLETWGERRLHKVKVTFTPGSSTDASDEYLYWFDPETGRLEQLAYSFGEGERGGLRFRRGLDYRRVGGVLFFDQENLGVDGGRVEVDVITPAYVTEAMKPISKVEHKDIRVEPLDPAH